MGVGDLKKIFLKVICIFLFCNFFLVNVFADTYVYDDLNRLVEVQYNSGQKVVYEYDKGGNIKSIIQIPGIVDLKLDSNGYELKVGAQHNTVVTTVYSDNTEKSIINGIKFDSENNEIATADKNGIVKGVKEGTVKINVSYGGIAKIINIKVIGLKDTLNLKAQAAEKPIKTNLLSINEIIRFCINRVSKFLNSTSQVRKGL
jgi:YD repeat-containing protein